MTLGVGGERRQPAVTPWVDPVTEGSCFYRWLRERRVGILVLWRGFVTCCTSTRGGRGLTRRDVLLRFAEYTPHVGGLRHEDRAACPRRGLRVCQSEVKNEGCVHRGRGSCPPPYRVSPPNLHTKHVQRLCHIATLKVACRHVCSLRVRSSNAQSIHLRKDV